jgi:DASS family divalent anion:Na+ symporter
MTTNRLLRFFAALFFAGLVSLIPTPEGLSDNAWQLFAIFLGTIVLVMTGAFPMGAASLMGLTAALLKKVLTFQQAFSGFTSPITWLILSAFFISYGLLHTGLGKRIALIFIALFGRTILGLAYSIGLSELVLAPGTPSSTARTGGIIYPVVESISRTFNSLPYHESRTRIGRYLVLCLFNFSVISSAMFMTAMAANPFAAKLAKNLDLNISWSMWALHAFPLGILSMIAIPLILKKLMAPEISDTSEASHAARLELAKLGRMSKAEKIMGLIFIILIVLWVLGPLLGIAAESAALLGLCLLLIFGIASWEHLLKITSAFETFIWFGALLGLADALSQSGFTLWFGEHAKNYLSTFPSSMAIIALFLIYFYLHYFFASSTAHVGALFLPIAGAIIALGAPALPAVLAMCFASSLYGSLTHYGLGPSPILSGSGFFTLRELWFCGFIMSIVNLSIWLFAGTIWWKFLGTI